MQAFGPYAAKETIDFTSLGNRTMFVISGKTGSGKTTIFDGISFAIYGKASGEDRNGPELRSQFARDDVLTEVTLEFSLKNKTYFIKRSPQQEKKKERGDGFRMIGATAELLLYEEDGKQQLLASNVRDVDEKIKEIMLIDSNQFRQILMIPQGEFRKLLTSDSKDKEVILQRLFHTELYKRIEEKLKDEATSLRKTVEQQLDERNEAIRNIVATHLEELKSELEAGSVNDTVVFPLLLEEMNLMNQSLDALSQEAKQKQKERDGLQQNIYEAEHLLKQLATLDQLKGKKEELEAQKEQFAKKEQEIVHAQKAAVLGHQEALCHRLKEDLDNTQENAAQIRAKLEQVESLLKEKEQLLAYEREREDERRNAAEAVSHLQSLQKDIEVFATVQQEVSALKQQLDGKQAQMVQAEQAAKRAEESLQSLITEKNQLEKGQLTFFENERKMERLAREHERLLKYEQQTSRYRAAKQERQKRKEFLEHTNARLQDGKDTLQTLEQRWFSGQASLLASQLHDGEACPVCGSANHPKPAHDQSIELPSEDDLKSAKEHVSQLEAEKGKAESSFYEIQSQVQSLQAIVQEFFQEITESRPNFNEDEQGAIQHAISVELKELERQQSNIKQEKLRLERIVEEMTSFEEQKKSYASQFEVLQKEFNERTISFTEKNTTLTRMVELIPAHLRSLSAFEKHLRDAIQHQELLQKRFEQAQLNYQEAKEHSSTEKARLQTVQQQAQIIDEKLKKERETFLIMMKEQGFDTYGPYKDAKRSEAEMAALEKAIRHYREEFRSVSDRYQDLSEVLKDVKAPDMDKLKQALKELDDEIAILQENYTNVLMAKRKNEELKEKIERINQQLKDLENRYQLIGHLYEISKGQNTYRITFERFVLAAFLDDILREANGRLSKMTSGRYELIRKTDRSKGNVQSGLELLVFDQYTGQERHVKTLSGGESFKAALSLALGLADVVQQYAGGVSLETMFIDEGFGTLDPESLDQAIEALIDIQSSGRLVGIISHVPELKERIDARLEVIATQSGSMTEFHFLN
jgi:exonuclease SbcC